MENLNSQSVLSPDPPYGSNWGYKIVALGFCLISPLLLLLYLQNVLRGIAKAYSAALCILSFTACLLKPQSILNLQGCFAFVSKSIPLVFNANHVQS